MTPTDRDGSSYVEAALDLHGFSLTATQRASVTRQFELLTAMAERFAEETPPADAEPAPVFRL